LKIAKEKQKEAAAKKRAEKAKVIIISIDIADSFFVIFFLFNKNSKRSF